MIDAADVILLLTNGFERHAAEGAAAGAYKNIALILT